MKGEAVDEFINNYKLLIPFDKRKELKNDEDIVNEIYNSVSNERKVRQADLKSVPNTNKSNEFMIKNNKINYDNNFHKALRLSKFHLTKRIRNSVTKIQARVRGFVVRKNIKSIIRVWSHIRFAISNLLRSIFKSEEDVNFTDEESAILTFLRSFKSLCKHNKYCGMDVYTSCSLRIEKELIRCKNIIEILEKIMNYVETNNKVKFADFRANIWKLLQHAHQYENDIEDVVMCGVYAFDPRIVDDSDSLGVQSTIEYQKAKHTYEVLGECEDLFQYDTKQLKNNENIAKKVESHIASIDTLHIGSVIEIDKMKNTLKKLNELAGKLREVCEYADPDWNHVNKVYNECKNIGLKWQIVDDVQVFLKEMKLKRLLENAIESSEVDELINAIEQTSAALEAEAFTAKAKNEASLRTKLVLKQQEKMNKQAKLSIDNPRRMLKLGDVLVEARRALNLLLELEETPGNDENYDEEVKLMEAVLSGSDSSSSNNNKVNKSKKSLLKKLVTQEVNTLNATLQEARSVRKHLQDDTKTDDKYVEQQNARRNMLAVLVDVSGKVDMYVQDRTARQNSKHLSKAPMRSKRYKPARVLGTELENLKKRVDDAIEIGKNVGLDRDLETLARETFDRKSFEDYEIEDAKMVTDLKNYSLELDDLVNDFRKIHASIRRSTWEVSTCADADKSKTDLFKLKKQLKRSLRMARIGCAPERLLVPIQYAYDALRSQNGAMLAQAVKNANRLLTVLNNNNNNNNINNNNMNMNMNLKNNENKKNKVKPSIAQRRASVASSIDPLADIRMYNELSKLLSPTEAQRLEKHLKNTNNKKEELLIDNDEESIIKRRPSRHRRSRSLAVNFATQCDVSMSTLSNNDVFVTSDSSYRHQLLLITHHAKQLIDSVLDRQVNASNPTPSIDDDTSLIYDHDDDDDDENVSVTLSDLSVVAVALGGMLRQRPNDVKDTDPEFTWAIKHMKAITELIGLFQSATEKIRKVLHQVAKYPFSTRYEKMNQRASPVNDDILLELEQHMITALNYGRDVGLPKSDLNILMDETEHISIFIEARKEALNEVKQLGNEIYKLHKDHDPFYSNARQLLPELNQLPMISLNTYQAIERDEFGDVRLLTLNARVISCIEDCILVAIPESVYSKLVREEKQILAYSECRILLRKAVYSCKNFEDNLYATNEMMWRFCERAGLTLRGLERPESLNKNTLKLTKQLRQILKAGLNKQKQNNVSTVKNTNNNDTVSLNSVESCRINLRDAIDSRDPTALDKAIAMARSIASMVDV